MADKIVMPQLGESIAEGTIVKWLKQPGDVVKKDENVLLISTDKVEAEIPSPAAGVLLSIDVKEGTTVAVGTVLGFVGAAGEAKVSTPAPAPAAAPAPAKATPAPAAAPAPAPAAAPASSSAGLGAATKVVMPQLGESIAEGTIVKWLKKPGDAVKKDENILLISTDKVEAEIPAPTSGTLVSIAVNEGQTVAVGTVLGYVGAAGAAVVAAPAAAPAPAPAPAPASSSSSPAVAAPPVAVAAPMAARVAPSTSDARFVSPLVRKIAADHVISDAELSSLPGTGNNGRVTKKDLQQYVDDKAAGKVATPVAAPIAAPAAAPVAAPVAAAAQAPRPAPTSSVSFAAGEREVVKPASPMRKVIMQNMVNSKQTSAHVHTFFDVDYSAVDRVRRAHKARFEAEEGVKLTYTVFLAAAIAQALRRHPYLNAEIRGTDIVFKKDVHLGMAVAIDTPEPGLMVPVIKHADQMNLRGLAHTITDLATRVRTRKIKPDEISGSTFTITNPGNYGAIIGTPVINQPNLAIFGVGRIQKEVVVREVDGMDTLAIRPMGVVSLGFDHRLIDGATADSFMADVKKTLETWDTAP
jgi:pyruvate dehydrogenase E2 component (dihydrolipoamide acetyltransferase)